MELAKKISDNLDDVFVLIEASKLSLDDDFMKHGPRTRREANFKALLVRVIEQGVKDFYRPRFDPSFVYDDGLLKLCFEEGAAPGTLKRDSGFYIWWKRSAEAFCPERGSRLGTRSEYIAFMGYLIKTMVANGWRKAEAWHQVCNDSCELGHYWDAKDSRAWFEATGSRKVCGFADLANTLKILLDDNDNGRGFYLNDGEWVWRGVWLAGGSYQNSGVMYPLAHMEVNSMDDYNDGVGWVVLEK